MARIPRIHQPISNATNGGCHTLDGNAAHYVAHVLRMQVGDQLLIFSTAIGEWLAEIRGVSKKSLEIVLLEQTRPPAASPDIWLLFAPVKNEKIDFLARRATELGVCALQPVKTRHTIVSRINEERLLANMIEAAEQCGRVDVPELKPFESLENVLSYWNSARILFHADESGNAHPVHEVLSNTPRGTPAAVIIGPEGGFSKEEHSILRQMPYIQGITLGPRILRAETAALTSLAHLQAWVGDGDKRPSFKQE